MTLIERWKEMDDSKMIKETQMLFADFSQSVNVYSLIFGNVIYQQIQPPIKQHR